MQDERNKREEQILLDLSNGKISLGDATAALCYHDSGDTLRRLAQAELVMPADQGRRMEKQGTPSTES